MRLFSQRKGIKKEKTIVQKESIDQDLRNKLWNVLFIFYWKQIDPEFPYRSQRRNNELDTLFHRMWNYLFSLPLDTLDDNCNYVVDKLREIYFKLPWNEVYDFIEFVATAYPDNDLNQKFMEFCNSQLEDERSAYRFVGGNIVEITSEVEIKTINEAINTPFDTINNHYTKALDLLSDRKKPDYPNSMKESMMGVEATCKLIANDDRADLHKALRAVEGKTHMHGALKSALDSLYGYSSDASNIRHAKIEYGEVNYNMAKFFLVMCTSFTNYLLSEASVASNVKKE